MSFQDILLNSLSNLQSDGDLRGAFQHIINTGVSAPGSQGNWHPNVDIVDTKNNLYIYAELPGVDENSISVDFFNNKLSISGNKIKKYSAPPTQRESTYGKFDRKITIPLSVTNQNNVIVRYNNGVLKLTIDKKKEEQNRFRLGVNTSMENDNDEESIDQNNSTNEE
jgi:HSP20 family protein